MRSASARARLVLALTLLACLATVTPAHAAKTKLSCTYSASIRISPGLSMTPGATSFTGTGTTVCVRNGGTALTGAFSVSGSTAALGTCVEGAGSGTFTATLATVGAGPVTLTGRFTFLRDGMVVQGPVTLTNNDTGFGTLAGAMVPGVGQTCLTTPVSRATLAGSLQVTGQIA